MSKFLTSQYQKEINASYKTLTKEEEVVMMGLAKNGDTDARDALVNAQLKSIISIAQSYCNAHSPLEDLIGQGVLGIDHAISLFDLNSGNRFYTFAQNWIRAKIQEYVLYNYTIRMPMNINKGALKASKMTEEERSEQEQKYLDDMFNSQTMSMDTPLDDDEKLTIGDRLASDYHTDENDLRNDIRKLLDCLDNTERKVIELHFGFTDDAKTLIEISKAMRMDRTKVSSILKSALTKLHNQKPLF